MNFYPRWTLAQYEAEKKQEKVHNTYYNNMVCYINNKNSDTDSHQSKVIKEPSCTHPPLP